MTEKKLIVATPHKVNKTCTCVKNSEGKIIFYSSACPFHQDEAKLMREE